MTENSNKTTCPVCGAEVPINEDSKKKGGVSGFLKTLLELDEAEKEDSAEKEVSRDPLQDVTVSYEKKSLGGKLEALLSHRFINRFIALFLAILMFAMMFAPFTKITVDDGNDDYELDFSLFDGLQISTISSLMSETSGLRDELLYDQNYSEIITKKQEEKLLVQSVLLYTLSGTSEASGSIFAATVLFVFYGIFCLTLLISSVKDLLGEVISIIRKRPSDKERRSDGKFCTVLCLLPAVCFCLMQMFRFCVKNRFISDQITADATLTWGAVASIVIATVGAALACATRFISELRKDARYLNGERMRSIVCAVLAVCVIIAIGLPLMKVDVWNTYGEATLTASATDITAISSDERAEYLYMSFVDELSSEIASLVRYNSIPENAGGDLITTLLIGSGMYSLQSSFDQIVALTGLTLLFAGLTLLCLLKKIFFGEEKHASINVFKVLTFICAALNTFILSTIKYSGLFYLNLNADYGVIFDLGTGIIIMLVCSFLAMIWRLKWKKEASGSGDKDFENADVSYAPYVVK